MLNTPSRSTVSAALTAEPRSGRPASAGELSAQSGQARSEARKAHYRSRRDAEHAAGAYSEAALLRAGGDPRQYELARRGDALLASSAAEHAAGQALTAAARQLQAGADTAALEHATTAALRNALKARRGPSRDTRANNSNAKGTYYDTEAMRGFAERAVLGYASRIGSGDIDGLDGLVALHDLVERAVGVACRLLVSPDNSHGYSWTDVGNRLGVDRRTAWENYHDESGRRRLRGTQLNGKQAVA